MKWQVASCSLWTHWKRILNKWNKTKDKVKFPRLIQSARLFIPSILILQIRIYMLVTMKKEQANFININRTHGNVLGEMATAPFLCFWFCAKNMPIPRVFCSQATHRKHFWGYKTPCTRLYQKKSNLGLVSLCYRALFRFMLKELKLLCVMMFLWVVVILANAGGCCGFLWGGAGTTEKT